MATSTLGYRLAHRAFLLGLFLKGVNATFELLVGALLLIIPFDTLQSWAAAAVAWLVSVVPFDWVGRIAGSLAHLHPGTLAFVAWYFLSHGVLKAVVIACLFQGKRWAYPLGIVIFVGFGVYQTWEIFHGGGVFYWVLNGLDATLIALTAMEWVHAARASSIDTASSSNPS